jgi:hypothetical protein
MPLDRPVDTKALAEKEGVLGSERKERPSKARRPAGLIGKAGKAWDQASEVDPLPWWGQ